MRKAFTLIEMMVATALTMFIMAIMSQAFVTSLDVFGNLKGAGDMEANLRTAAMLLRSDLSSDHFEAKRRLSDPDFWTRESTRVFFPDMPTIKTSVAAYPFSPATNASFSYFVDAPVREGFFHLHQGSASVLEGQGLPDNVNSYLAADHVLYFTVKLRGNQREKIFSAPIPPGSPLALPSLNFFNQLGEAVYQENAGTFCSQWAEVAYFLVKTGTTDNPTDGSASPPFSSGPQNLYALYRFQAAIVPRNGDINGYPENPASPMAGAPIVPPAGSNPPAYMSWIQHPNVPGAAYFSNPSQLTHPLARSLDVTPVNASAAPYTTFPVRQGTAGPPGDAALLLTNVISFNVQALTTNNPTNFADIGVFDSSQNTSGNRILALKIVLRVWDAKGQQARQVTVIQDM